MTGPEQLRVAAETLRMEHKTLAEAPREAADSLAKWLEYCANDLADARHYVDEPVSANHALAFARVLLGESE